MSKFPINCPRCKHKAGAWILYGEPIFEVIEEDLNRGALVLGGCCCPIDGADRQCTHCGYSWIANRAQWREVGERWRLPERFFFEMSAMDLFLQIDWQGTKVELKDGWVGEPRVVAPPVKLLRETMFQFDSSAIDLSAWSYSYQADDMILDGTQWELKLVTDGRSTHSQGDNAYPEHSGPDYSQSGPFSALLWALNPFAPEIFESLIEYD